MSDISLLINNSRYFKYLFALVTYVVFKQPIVMGVILFQAHKSTIWIVKHLPQNRDVFMTLGGSGSLNLWK